MAALVLGPALGGLVGAAVYYTISQTISDRTSFIRSQLHTISTQLTHSSASSSIYIPTPPPPTRSREPLSSLLASRWNNTLSSLVHSLETSNIDTLTHGITTISTMASSVITDRLIGFEKKVERKLEKLDSGEGLVDPGSELGAEVFFDGKSGSEVDRVVDDGGKRLV